MPTTIPLIQLENIEKVFLTDEVETHALSGVRLEICHGDYVSVSERRERVDLVGPLEVASPTQIAVAGAGRPKMADEGRS